jgi:hypothetical protein
LVVCSIVNAPKLDEDAGAYTAAFDSDVPGRPVTVTRFLVLTLFAIMLASCSVIMAAKQPEKKNVELFNIGTPGSMLLAEFGMPVGSELRGQEIRIL